MSAQNVIEILGLVLGGGGGAQLVSKLTRVAVAVEQLVESHKTLTGQVADHEKRLNKGGLLCTVPVSRATSMVSTHSIVTNTRVSTIRL